MVDYKTYFQKKYPHLPEAEISRMESSAKEILVHLLFPYVAIPKKEHYKKALEAYPNWIYDCIDCFIERSGMNSVVAYSENGISIKYGKDGISQDLINRVRPIAGVF